MKVVDVARLLPEPMKDCIKNYMAAKRPQINKMSVKEREKNLTELWRQRRGTELDFDHPVTFTEKLQWMKIYYNHPDLWRCVDKCEFKKYVAERIGDGYTAKMIREWSSPKDVSLEGLPDKFVIKSNSQSDGNYIVIVNGKNKFDRKKIERKIKQSWFRPENLLINSYCSAYYNVKPKVFVEEYLEEFEEQLSDYKLFCFNGEPKFFYVATEHFDDGKNGINYPISFYDLSWNRMNVRYGNHRQEDMRQPKHMEEMIELAKKLSKGFPFVRVDFFDTGDKLYLAELTFYPGGGWVSYYPEDFDKEMGDMLNF